MLPSLLGLLSVLFLKINCESISDSGWRPISREEVFNSRNFVKMPVYTWNSDTDRTFSRENIKVPESLGMYTNSYPGSADVRREAQLTINSNEEKEKSVENPTATQIYLKPDTLRTETLSRKAKKISNEEFSDNDNVINDSSYEMEESKTIGDYKNTYAVTEHLDNDITSDQSNIDEGYKYTPVKEETRRNPTENFLNILANYNIRSSDRLPNYALSLRQNSRQSNKFIYMQVPIRVPVGYNSPNHALADPLLAVFLSNYGYYLPGSFGVTGNYRNHYGYSAANNIHNNKPFGSYKIYSDTDSFH